MHHKGMTLVETVILVGVVSILTAITLPSINLYIDYRHKQIEQMDLIKIRKALILFAKTYNRLPSETAGNNALCQTTNNTWNECLALFTDLSAEQIATDAWGEPRTYLHQSLSEPFRILAGNMQVDYASLHSKGPDRTASVRDKENQFIDGIGISGTNFAVPAHTEWWVNQSTTNAQVGQFRQLRAGRDDFMIKFSDLMIKLEKYEETQVRMEAIGEALAAYANLKRQERIAAGDPNYGDLIYYPLSYENPAYGTTPAAVKNWDGNRLQSEMNQYDGVSIGIIENRDNTVAQRVNRLRDMTGLMRMLGLPDEYCCDALVKDATINGDYTQDRPFFYYTNPAPSTAGICSPRAQQVPFMPATVRRDPQCG